jgi:hypothetical protein
MEKERIAEEEEEAENLRQERLEQRKLESHQLLAEQLKKDIMGEGNRHYTVFQCLNSPTI